MQSGKKGLLSLLNLDSLIDTLLGYVEKRVALLKIELKEELAKTLASMVVVVVLVLVVTMIILFLSIGLAGYINLRLGSNYLGFVVVAGVYSILLILVILLQSYFGLEKKLRRIFMELINKNNTDE